jgi:hypothetical protein
MVVEILIAGVAFYIGKRRGINKARKQFIDGMIEGMMKNER